MFCITIAMHNCCQVTSRRPGRASPTQGVASVIRVRSEIDLIVLKKMQPSQPRLRNQLVPRQPDLLPLPNQGDPARHLPFITNAHRQHMSSHTRPAVTTTEQLHTSQRMASTHAPLQHVRAQQRGTILRDHAPSFGSRSQAICRYKPVICSAAIGDHLEARVCTKSLSWLAAADCCWFSARMFS